MSVVHPPMPAVRLNRSAFESRSLRNGLLTAGAWAAAIIAGIPLVSVLYMLIVRGGARLGWEALTALPPAGFEMDGGFGNAILGTIVMVGLGGLLSIPIGVLAAVYLAELGPARRLSQIARFATKTLTGMPSILAGVFAYAVVVLLTGKYSAPAGGMALAVLMLPTVILTAEGAIKAVPKITRDAAFGMGCTRSQVVWKVLLPTAMPGILIGVMLAVARAAGETAPLLFTALFSSYWLFENGVPKLMQPTASLAVLIYNFAGMPMENQIELAWARARLVPITAGIVVLAYNIPGLTRPLRLSRDVCVDIFAGRIRTWSDPRIRAVNPGVDLPNRSIAVVARQDGSGTTFALTNHVSAVSETWRDRGPGAANLVDWRGMAMLARGNEGVAARIKGSEYSIGYVEYNFARRLGLAMAHLQNRAGQYVEPGERSGQMALAANVKQMPTSLRLFLPDPDGAESYPIVTFSWFLLYARYPEADRAAALKKFVTWSLTTGQSFSRDLGYIALPPEVSSLSLAAVDRIN